MVQYILRRLAQFVPVFLGVTLLLFFITTILPGDPVALRAGQRQLPPAVYAALRHSYGLDKPWYVQYVNYLGSLSPVHVGPKGGLQLTGPDLGESISSGRPVLDIFKETYPYTVRLALSAIIIEILVGIGVGIVAAVRAVLRLGHARDARDVGPGGSAGVLARPDAAVLLRDHHEAVDGRGVLPADLGGERTCLPGLGLPDPAIDHTRVRLHRVRGPDHAQPASRGVGTGLRPDRVREGSRRQRRAVAARDEERADPGGDLHRAGSRRDAVGRDPDRDGLQLARRGTDDLSRRSGGATTPSSSAA